MRHDLDTIWERNFKERYPKYQIKRKQATSIYSSVYLLEENKELQITLNRSNFEFAKKIKQRRYKHVAKIYDCFKAILPDKNGEEQYVYCIVSEVINRNYFSESTIQTAIKLFRETWSDYFKSINALDESIDVCIEKAYALNDKSSRNVVFHKLMSSGYDSQVLNIVLALNDVYSKVKELDSRSVIYLNTENIGVSADSVVKICNIGSNFVVLDENYETDTTSNSVTITYDPLLLGDVKKDYRLLLPMDVILDNGKLLPVLGQIDTGATMSGVTMSLFQKASLANLGKVKLDSSTGSDESILTECKVIFPNKYKATLRASVMNIPDGVQVIIGMDLLSKCKLHSEPHNFGFRYKLTFF